MTDWDGIQANGHHEVTNLLLARGLELVEEHEGPAAADQCRAAVEAGEWRRGIDEDHHLVFFRCGTGEAERPLIAIPLGEVQEMLDLLYPNP